MIANVSPANNSFEESHNTLKYANRAKNIPVSAAANMMKFEKIFSKTKHFKLLFTSFN